MKRQIKNIKEDIQGGVYYDTSIPYNSGEDRSRREEMSDSRFFKIVEGIVKYINYDKLKSHIEVDELWDRVTLVKDVTKLYGMGGKSQVDDSDGLIHAMYWAAIENYDGIKDGTITNFSQLEVRPLKSYEVKMWATEDEYVDYHWTVTAQGYDENDVMSEVQVNEDGLYDWWEWENKPGFHREVSDSERREWEVQEIKEIPSTKGKLSEHWWEEETTDKWGLLEKDMREAMDKIIEDHKSNWGGDQYNVMGAIEEIMENLFQKVSIRESFMSDPKVAKYFENKDILKYLKGKDRELVSDAVEMLRGWGRFNPIMTDLSPFLTDATENLKGEYAREILQWATENESFPPDYDQFFEELDREEVSWLWENGQDVRDALTRSAILLADDTDGGQSMDVLNKVFKQFASKAYRFILTGEWLEGAQDRRREDPDQDAMGAIMVDAPDGLREQWEDNVWSSEYLDMETDNKEDYLTELFSKLHYHLMHDEEIWANEGNDHDLLYLLTQEMNEIIEDLEHNQEQKTADKLEKIVSPLWDYEDEIKDAMDKHRRILMKVVGDLKDLMKIYGIRGVPKDLKYRP